ncbi:hybrid sensor histidine kinase/response regulator [bacterium]|nr:hybrid sensor histidine kinase/response regulator [bacterium]
MQTKNTLLIIDDSPEDIEIIRSLFKDFYVIKAVKTGVSGVALMLKEPTPDLILLDIILPDINGFDVCRKIKETPENCTIPVIFITSKTNMEDKIRGFNEGGVDYITKPFEPEEVIARVKTHMELQQARKTIYQYNHKLESMLEIRTKELIQSERQAVFGQMVQGIVHNLSNPISGIMNSQELIQLYIQDFLKISDTSSCNPDTVSTFIDDVQKSCEVIGHAAEQLSQIIQTLLNRGRIDKAERWKRVDLNGLIRLELNFLESDMRYKHQVDKQIELAEKQLPIDVNPGEITQVFHNIINNALHALQGRQNGLLTVRTWNEHNLVFFSVQDNGPGISEAIRDRIFDPFFTTKAAGNDPEASPDMPTGTGLGLWMCRETIDRYHGSIVVDSGEGTGTVFTVSIPGSA